MLRNAGSQPARGRLRTDLVRVGPRKGRRVVRLARPAVLAPGEAKTVRVVLRFNARLKSGQHVLQFVYEPGRRVPSDPQSNNARSTTLNVTH